MQHDQQASPLPPDPIGREDIMSAQPRDPDATPRNQQAQPLPPDPIGREDIMSPQPRVDAAPRNQQASPLPLTPTPAPGRKASRSSRHPKPAWAGRRFRRSELRDHIFASRYGRVGISPAASGDCPAAQLPATSMSQAPGR